MALTGTIGAFCDVSTGPISSSSTMSHVRDIDSSSVNQKLVTSLTSLCQEMGMLVFAEGKRRPLNGTRWSTWAVICFKGTFSRTREAVPHDEPDSIAPFARRPTATVKRRAYPRRTR
jgi:hypothetical protein